MAVIVKFCSHCGRMRAYDINDRVAPKRCQECLQGEFKSLRVEVDQQAMMTAYGSLSLDNPTLILKFTT